MGKSKHKNKNKINVSSGNFVARQKPKRKCSKIKGNNDLRPDYTFVLYLFSRRRTKVNGGEKETGKSFSHHLNKSNLEHRKENNKFIILLYLFISSIAVFLPRFLLFSAPGTSSINVRVSVCVCEYVGGYEIRLYSFCLMWIMLFHKLHSHVHLRPSTTT